jgi:uncharacterized protein YfkK (UPF0435 family)
MQTKDLYRQEAGLKVVYDFAAIEAQKQQAELDEQKRVLLLQIRYRLGRMLPKELTAIANELGIEIANPKEILKEIYQFVQKLDLETVEALASKIA